MDTVSPGRTNGGDIEIYFEDDGSGPPVVLTPWFPFTTRTWQRHESILVEIRLRVAA